MRQTCPSDDDDEADEMAENAYEDVGNPKQLEIACLLDYQAMKFYCPDKTDQRQRVQNVARLSRDIPSMSGIINIDSLLLLFLY